ncbi:C-mannosyltransferase dpy-19 homolog [Glossina fuscipes]|uniref:C-mannosyltransferase dpy-19 homolog n=1 Tax=Glossina fuscipes TaxID=7396 RepID=A0A9C6DRJ4_9MUSC|nr:C-mannosyltransferase dpy-19 homolog [Glossina fuscipes]KAI9582272.1 hypothetical protein GQX74_015395 [Glossina fuscipes]
MHQQKLLLMLGQSLIGTGFFFLYIQHVRSVFETRTNIAHLTQLERESLFRGEDALYYSFYKTLTEAPDFMSGIERLQNLTDIEYPRNVNVIHRFHVLPELIIGALYHFLRSHQRLGLLSLFSCWRSDDIRLTLEYGNCEGQAMQFYTECVWLLGGFTMLLIYMYGLLLSRNMFGGIYAVTSYIMFHSFASKIYESPAARENFAFPAIFMQMFYLCFCINQLYERKAHSLSILTMVEMSFLTALALLCWQFSTVIFASQILIMMVPWILNSTTQTRLVNVFINEYAATHLMAIWLAYSVSDGNKRYIFAWQLGPAIGLFFISMIRFSKQQSSPPLPDENNIGFSLKILPMGFLISIFSFCTIIDIFEATGFVRSIENTYILYRDLVIHWLLQMKVNFVTTLTACKPEYKRMDCFQLWDFVKTLVVKPYCMYGVVMLAKFFRKWRKSTEPPEEPKADVIERAKNYILEDFLEEHHISMTDILNKKNEHIILEFLDLLAKCGYDYELYKKEKAKLKKEKPNDHLQFLNDIKKLKEQIQENHKKSSEEKGRDEIHRESTEEMVEQSERKEKAANENGKKISSTGTSKKAATKLTSASSQETRANDSDDEGVYDYRQFHYVYSFLQMAVFTVIGLSIRKLFFLCFTQGCVLTSTICSLLLSGKQRNLFWSAYLYVFLASVIHPGIVNIQDEYYPNKNVANQNLQLDSMLEWIKMNTEKDAVFAGPVDIIGTVHLTTRRPIVNHAHLEIRQMSDRTEHVYSVFSRQQSSDIYNQCSQLKIQYLILSTNDCTNEINDECDLLSIWDDMQPAYRKYPQFCSELLNKNIPSFLKVFSNEKYAIVKMFSHSVQINLKFNKMPEKDM